MSTGTFRTSFLFCFLAFGMFGQLPALAQELDNSRLIEATFMVESDNPNKVDALIREFKGLNASFKARKARTIEPVYIETMGVYVVTGQFTQKELDDLRESGFEESERFEVNLFEGASCDDPDPLEPSQFEIVPKNVCRIVGSPSEVSVSAPAVWIIDSGIDIDAVDQGLFNVVEIYDCTQSPCNGPFAPGNMQDAQDNVGHGTMVAGIIGAKRVAAASGFIGMKGVAPNAPLKIVKAFDRKNADLFGAPNIALELVRSKAAAGDILNISWGAGFLDSARRAQQFDKLRKLDLLVHAIAKKQVRIVVAAGNGERDKGPWVQTIFPANAAPYPPAGGIYSVSAADSRYSADLPSECGATGGVPRWCDLFWRPGAFGATYSEPGVDILSIWKSPGKNKKKGLRQNTCSGTSFAAPGLSGMLARGLSPTKVAIKNTVLADGTDGLGYISAGTPDDSSGVPQCK